MRPLKNTAGDDRIDNAEVDEEIDFLLWNVRAPDRKDYLDAAERVRRAAGFKGEASPGSDAAFWRRVVAELVGRASLIS